MQRDGGGLYDPIAAAKHVSDAYANLARHALKTGVSRDSDVKWIMESLELSGRLFLSANPRYEMSALPFGQLCAAIGLSKNLPGPFPKIKRLYAHQEEAVRSISSCRHTVIATGTGSGKTESFLIPVIDYCLREREKGIKAVIVYPTNALAADQLRRIGECASAAEITYGVYTGDTPRDELEATVERESRFHLAYRSEMLAEPPDILVTNHVMLDRMLTRSQERWLFTECCHHLHFVVLDEVHSYKGNRATHLRFLLRRLKNAVPNPVVQICCSATLDSRNSGEAVNRFICPLLDVAPDEYDLVRPAAKSGRPENPPQANLQSATTNACKVFRYNVASMDSPGAALANLNSLLGTSFTREDLADPDRLLAPDGPRALLLSSPCMQAIAESLRKGSKSMEELSGAVSDAISGAGSPEEILRGSLAAASFIDSSIARAYPNPHNRPDPVLDFRVHLFMHEIQGLLRRCIRCGKYHAGQSESCTKCGAPLFFVYGKDTAKCIARLESSRLLPHLEADEGSRGLQVYVLVGYDAPAEGRGCTETFRVSIAQIGGYGSIEFAYDENGPLSIERLRVDGDEAIEALGVLMSPKFADYQYTHCIARSMLDTTRPRRKLLAFVDSREQATRQSRILDDEFASALFEEMLRIYCLQHNPSNIEEAHLGLQEELAEFASGMSEPERNLAQEFDVWFARFISIPSRNIGPKREFMQIVDADQFKQDELDVLSVFVEERAILKQAPRLPADLEGRAIRYSLHQATSLLGIHFEGQRSGLRDYPGRALSTNPNCKHLKMVARTGEAKVKSIVKDLVSRGPLLERITPDGKQYFYISPKQLKFDLGPSEFASIHEVWQELADRVRPHSAEIRRVDRVDTERDFAAGKISMVVATPTLELGIDIGKLQAILLMGVPPTPANYAQRAGRAGRGQGGGHSLIVTICSEQNPNDMVYYHDPHRMIDGVVSPPAFNAKNLKVAVEHANAMALAGHVSDEAGFRQRIAEIAEEPERFAEEIRNVIDVPMDIGQYLGNKLCSNAIKALKEPAASRVGSFEQFLYNQTNLMPDFAFRDDQVLVCDEEGLRRAKEIGAHTFTDEIIISSRDPELAAYIFVPGQQVHMAGDVFIILASGEYESRQAEGLAFDESRVYRAFAAQKDELFAEKRPRLLRQDIVCKLDRIDTGRNYRAVLWAGYSRHAQLAIANRGPISPDRRKGTGFLDQSTERHFIIEYPMERETLVFGFERDVCGDASLYISTSLAILRGIKSMYKLDDSEIGMMIDADFVPSSDSPLPGSNRVVYVALYDATGNNCLRLEDIYADLDSMELFAEAYEIVASCDCDRQGCHRCLRGYESRPWASQINASSAMMFLAYLLGEGKFRPCLAPVDEKSVPDITLEVTIRGDQVELGCNGDVQVHRFIHDQNTEIFAAMNEVLLERFHSGIECVRIITRASYIRNALLQQGTVDEGKEALADLLVTLSMFKNVEAVDRP